MEMFTIVLDVGFVLAAVAFFKKRLGLEHWSALLAAFLVTLVVVFLPEFIALFPQYSVAVEKLVLVIQLFISAPGVFDLVVDLKSRTGKVV